MATAARSAKKGKRARRTPLSPERVLDAAMRMADEGGLEALTMRRLAQALNVEAMSLYNHVANKEQILDGLVERVVGEIGLLAPDEDWRVAMRHRARSAHTVLMRHPWATRLFASRLNVGPNMLRYVDHTLGCLRRAGFSYAMADHAWNALDAYIYGFTLHKLKFPLAPSECVTAARRFLPFIPVDQFPYLHGLSLEVIEGRHDGLHDLDLGLDLLLDGLGKLRRFG
jgi:AcrR family transcriptional regulator